jgi:hypothetical protein
MQDIDPILVMWLLVIAFWAVRLYFSCWHHFVLTGYDSKEIGRTKDGKVVSREQWDIEECVKCHAIIHSNFRSQDASNFSGVTQSSRKVNK